MKSFLVSLIIASVTLAETPCNPIPLYRKRSRNFITGMVDRIDTTDINEADANYVLERQIATICSQQAPGTIPLYRGYNMITRFHMPTIDVKESKFAGYKQDAIRGYVYTQPQNGQTGFFKVYRLVDSKTGINFFSSDQKNEGAENGRVYDRDLFWSLPLDANSTTYYSSTVTPVVVSTTSIYESSHVSPVVVPTATTLGESLPCNPIPLYRKRSRNFITGMVDRIDTTNINEADANYMLERQIATICSQQAPGTIPLYRGYNMITRFHMPTIDVKESKFAGYKQDAIRGYVYTQPQNGQTGFFKVYRLVDSKTGINFFSSEKKNEGAENGRVYDRDLFWSLPLDANSTTYYSSTVTPVVVSTTSIYESSNVSPVVVPTTATYDGPTVAPVVEITTTPCDQTSVAPVVEITSTPCDQTTVAPVVEVTSTPCEETTVAPVVECSVPTYDSQTVAPVVDPIPVPYEIAPVVDPIPVPYDVAPVVDPIPAPYDVAPVVNPTPTPCDESCVAPVVEPTAVPCPETSVAPIAIETPYPTPVDVLSYFPSDINGPIFSSAYSRTASIAGVLLAVVLSI